MHPFDHAGPPTHEQLLAYVQGRLSPAEQHAVEAHMERDPLLRDAVEGLQQPGAVDALQKLDGMRPTKPSGVSGAWWIVGGVAVLIAVVGIPYFTSTAGPEKKIAETTTGVVAGSAARDLNQVPLANAEILAAVEQPRPERIGHERMALHTREAARLSNSFLRCSARRTNRKNQNVHKVYEDF